MSAFVTLVEAALAAPLATARQYALTGTAIGCVGAEVPVEVIRASGAYALRLPAPVLAATPRADLLLESSFMPAIRSMAECYLRGDFDFLHTIVFPRSNDSAQRLYYYLCEHQRAGHRGPRLLIYDLAKIPRAASREHTAAATRRLALALGAADERLDGALGQRNRRVALMHRAEQLRFAGRARGSHMERLARAAGFCDPQEFDRLMLAFLEGYAHPPLPGPRLLLVGSTPPDDRLHRRVESAGGNVVAEFGDHAFREARQLSVVQAAADLPAAYHASDFGPRAFADRAAQLKQLAAASSADGVIFWLVSEEDAYIWDLPSQRAALAQTGTASLVLTQRRWDAMDDTGASIDQFVRALPGALR